MLEARGYKKVACAEAVIIPAGLTPLPWHHYSLLVARDAGEIRGSSSRFVVRLLARRIVKYFEVSAERDALLVRCTTLRGQIGLVCWLVIELGTLRCLPIALMENDRFRMWRTWLTALPLRHGGYPLPKVGAKIIN